MALSGSEKRELTRRGHALKPQLALVAASIAQPHIEHLRKMFERLDLIKVRLEADERTARHAAASQLAEQVPCEVVQEIGHVVLLWRGAGDAVRAEPV
ncbi:MAG: YhbY family RNA-binding protein [Planctomycetota bacterium]